MNRSLGKGVVYVASMSEGFDAMKDREGGEVRPVCGPSSMKPQYFIGRTGTMYVCRPYKDAYIYYQRQYFLNNGRIPVYELAHTSGERLRCNASKLLYCTFILGYWDDDVKVGFADGNPQNMHLDNIVHKEMMTEVAAINMREMGNVYQKYFSYVVNYLVYFKRISREEAQDVTQDTFIEMMKKSRHKGARNFVGLWIYESCLLAMSVYNNSARFDRLDLLDVKPGVSDPEFEFDIFSYLGHNKSAKCLDLQVQGASQKEIAEELVIPLSSVAYHLSKTKQKLREYLLQDKLIASLINSEFDIK